MEKMQCNQANGSCPQSSRRPACLSWPVSRDRFMKSQMFSFRAGQQTQGVNWTFHVVQSSRFVLLPVQTAHKQIRIDTVIIDAFEPNDYVGSKCTERGWRIPPQDHRIVVLRREIRIPPRMNIGRLIHAVQALAT